MATFRPIREVEDLPRIGARFEHALLDLKVTVNPRRPFELAKDAAMFANHLGGTILVGVAEKAGFVSKFLPLETESVNEIQRAYEGAIKNRCSPRPMVDFARIPQENGFVLAVNVWPHFGVIGVSAKADKQSEGYGDLAYVFPVRVGSDSRYLLPEQLPMLMSPELRRIVILLGSIPRDTVVLVENVESPFASPFFFHGIDEMLNTVTLSSLGESQAKKIYPLDQIRTAWCAEGRWYIRFHPAA